MRSKALASAADKVHSQQKDDWDKAYNLIKLENDLVNQRLTSLLACQAFLFTVFTYSAVKYVDTNLSEGLERGLLICILVMIPLAGIAVSSLVTTAMRAALRQINASGLWLKYLWTDTRCDYFRKAFPFPPITGRKSGLSFLLWRYKVADRHDAQAKESHGACTSQPTEGKSETCINSCMTKLKPIAEQAKRLYRRHFELVTPVTIAADSYKDYYGINCCVESRSCKKVCTNYVTDIDKIEELSTPTLAIPGLIATIWAIVFAFTVAILLYSPAGTTKINQSSKSVWNVSLMHTTTTDDAIVRLSELMDRACSDHTPVTITRPGKQPVVLVSEEDYYARIALISTKEPRP